MTVERRPQPIPASWVRPQPPPEIDAHSLEADLRRSVADVRFDDGTRAEYSTDASNYRQVPIGAVLPRNADEIATAIETCRRHAAPVLPRGGGTSLAGQSCNVAVIIDCSRYMHTIRELDAERRRARVEPGVVLDDLIAAADPHGLTFAPDPATHSHCTLGGMIGNNSCGVHSVLGGCTADNVEELEVLTYDGVRLRVGATDEKEWSRLAAQPGRSGEIYRRLRELRDRYADQIRSRFPDIPRRVSGYALDELLPEKGGNVARALVGTEGTCATVLEATLRLLERPPARSLLVLGYPDIYAAADDVAEVVQRGPIGLEGMDDRLVGYVRRRGEHREAVDLLPAGEGWLLVELGGEDQAAANDAAQTLMGWLGERREPPSMRLFDGPEHQAMLWEVRESGLGSTAFVPDLPDTWPGWEDSAVAPERLGDYLRDLRALYDRYGYIGAFYGHFGQGCLHVRNNFELRTPEGIARYRSFVDDAAELVVRYGGSLSGEHGDGQARGELLPKLYGEELTRAFSEFKAIWDPDDRMNPGKVVHPAPLTGNLRLGADYAPPPVETHFAFPEDEGSFARAALRCVGVGKCRRAEGGVMCPSYMVTREEEHSTRGRARRLFEMLNGRELSGGWRDDHVKDALDLCLACKGCKRDCPVNVDMATYKAEFLSHYYAGRLRPRNAYAFGWIMRWARLAALAPDLVNLAARLPGLGAAAKAAAGMAPARQIPQFARRTFRDWFAARPPRRARGQRVVLWPDTFNDHFQPQTARAAVEVLEHAGYHVTIPERRLCCGRPLYDYGMLDTAKRFLREILDELRPDIRAGTPIVGLEPSCVAVFRDELPNLLPDDEDARRLSQHAVLLSELLVRDGVELPQLEGRAIVQRHCHHSSVLGFDAEERVLAGLGLDIELLDSGCCGMAGSFGFERGDRYEVSIKAGERVLLPRVRQAEPATFVLADGYSCREQIAQGSERRGLHLAELLEMAWRREAGDEPAATPAERDYLRWSRSQVGGSPARSIAVGLGAAVGAAAIATSAVRAARRR